MFRTHRDDHRLAAQDLVLQRRIRNGWSHETYIQPTLSQRRELQWDGHGLQLQADCLVTLIEHAHRFAHIHVVHAVTNRDPHTSCLAEAGSTRAECSRIGTREHVSCVLEKLPAGIGEFDTPFGAVEEGGLELLLKSLNLVRQRGLCDTELRSRVTEMQGLRDSHKTPDLLQFHNEFPSNRIPLLIREAILLDVQRRGEPYWALCSSDARRPRRQIPTALANAIGADEHGPRSVGSNTDIVAGRALWRRDCGGSRGRRLSALSRPDLGRPASFITLFPAIMLSAWLGGLGPGLLTTAITGVAAEYCWIEPARSFAVGDKTELVALLVFMAVGVVISALNEAWRRGTSKVALSEERLKVTLTSIADGVITTDDQGRVTRLNAIAEQLTGWASADAIGRPLPEVFVILNEQSRAPAQNPVDRVLREGLIAGLGDHTVLLAKDGREIRSTTAPRR